MASVLRSVMAIGLLLSASHAAASPPRSDHVLMVLAHPDDETMIGGLIRRLQERGVPMSLAYATYGEGGDIHWPWLGQLRSVQTPSFVMRPIRRVESALALTLVKPRHVYWLQQIDEGYTTNREAFARSQQWNVDEIETQLRSIVVSTAANVLIVPGQQTQAHAHHKTIAAIATALFRSGELPGVTQVYEFDETGWIAPDTQPGDLVLPRRADDHRGSSYSEFQLRLSACYFTQGPAHLKWLKPKRFDAAETLRSMHPNGPDPLRKILAAPPDESLQQMANSPK